MCIRDSIYTYVTLKDCELPVRKGSLTPINEGYANAGGAHRCAKYATPVSYTHLYVTRYLMR